MGYLERLLIPGEAILHRARRSVWPTFAAPVAVNVLAVAAAIAASLLAPGPGLLAWALPLASLGWLGWRWVWWTNKVYLVTNHRVMKLEGVLAKSHGDASLDKINDMQLSQGLAARLFGYGDLEIATANEAASVTYHFLKDPVEFKRKALIAREAARPAAGPAESDPVAQLERLAALREKGAVTQEEFEAAKARLLGQLK